MCRYWESSWSTYDSSLYLMSIAQFWQFYTSISFFSLGPTPVRNTFNGWVILLLIEWQYASCCPRLLSSRSVIKSSKSQSITYLGPFSHSSLNNFSLSFFVTFTFCNASSYVTSRPSSDAFNKPKLLVVLNLEMWANDDLGFLCLVSFLSPFYTSFLASHFYYFITFFY